MEKTRLYRADKALALLLGLGAGFILVVFVLKPPCLILKCTGFYCAGCGGQRMMWSALRGDFFGAFRQNPFLFVFLPLAACYALWEAVRYIKAKPPLYKTRAFLWAARVLLALAVLFTVLRNLPGFQWLAPQ